MATAVASTSFTSPKRSAVFGVGVQDLHVANQEVSSSDSPPPPTHPPAHARPRGSARTPSRQRTRTPQVSRPPSSSHRKMAGIARHPCLALLKPSSHTTLPVQALAYNSSHGDHSQLRQTLACNDDSFATTPACNTSIRAHSLATCSRPVHSQPRLRIPGFLCTSRTSCTSYPLNQGESPAARHGSSKDPQRYPLSPCP
jgi:hypothetical protein